MSREKWGSSQSWWCRSAVWPPGENWGGYIAASRSPSAGADAGAARAATPAGGVDRDNSSSRAIASASASISIPIPGGAPGALSRRAALQVADEVLHEAAVEAVVGARRELAAGRRDAEIVATREARRRGREEDRALHQDRVPTPGRAAAQLVDGARGRLQRFGPDRLAKPKVPHGSSGTAGRARPPPQEQPRRRLAVVPRWFRCLGRADAGSE